MGTCQGIRAKRTRERNTIQATVGKRTFEGLLAEKTDLYEVVSKRFAARW
jgi:hypothetical protein